MIHVKSDDVIQNARRDLAKCRDTSSDNHFNIDLYKSGLVTVIDKLPFVLI